MTFSDKLFEVGVQLEVKALCTHDVDDLVGFSLSDQTRYCLVDQQHFKCSDPSTAFLLQQNLADDTDEDIAECGADLRVLICREHIDNPVDGAQRCVCVERTKDEVTGVCGFECEHHRFSVTKLTDEDDVGIFPHRGFECVCEAPCVRTNLALVDERFFAWVDKFDGIFERNDMFRSFFVELVDQRCECC